MRLRRAHTPIADATAAPAIQFATRPRPERVTDCAGTASGRISARRAQKRNASAAQAQESPPTRRTMFQERQYRERKLIPIFGHGCADLGADAHPHPLADAGALLHQQRLDLAQVLARRRLVERDERLQLVA